MEPGPVQADGGVGPGGAGWGGMAWWVPEERSIVEGRQRKDERYIVRPRQRSQ